MKSSLTREQEEYDGNISLPLPYAGLPDLSSIRDEDAMRRLLAHIDPDAAPETINRQADMHWRTLSGLQRGDLIVMPYTYRKEYGIGEVTDRYHYEVVNGEDMHTVQITWKERHVKPKKLAALLRYVNSPLPLQMVEHAEQRKAVFRCLKRGGLVNWQWIIGLMFIIQVIRMLVQENRF
jgi:predicted Mrr-cat superfamily restriction endonuclease